MIWAAFEPLDLLCFLVYSIELGKSSRVRPNFVGETEFQMFHQMICTLSFGFWMKEMVKLAFALFYFYKNYKANKLSNFSEPRFTLGNLLEFELHCFILGIFCRTMNFFFPLSMGFCLQIKIANHKFCQKTLIDLKKNKFNCRQFALESNIQFSVIKYNFLVGKLIAFFKFAWFQSPLKECIFWPFIYLISYHKSGALNDLFYFESIC